MRRHQWPPEQLDLHPERELGEMQIVERDLMQHTPGGGERGREKENMGTLRCVVENSKPEDATSVITYI